MKHITEVISGLTQSRLMLVGIVKLLEDEDSELRDPDADDGSGKYDTERFRLISEREEIESTVSTLESVRAEVLKISESIKAKMRHDGRG